MLKVADLYCGMGGLSCGFSSDFQVTGYDINKFTESIYKKNKIGTGIIHDLLDDELQIDADIIIGGPPCKPWSSVNTTKREKKHPDYILIEKYFNKITKFEPDAFLMENVPAVKNDKSYLDQIKKLESKYSIENIIVKYHEYGSATKRRRLITAGFKNIDVNLFLNKIKENGRKPKTVGTAIKKFENREKYSVPDHEWPNLKTISKYDKYYKTGKFGWYQLSYDDPAPSFGNVMKTYTLHPMAGINGYPLRVVSVREVMAIMGFVQKYVFPKEMGHTMKYQMVADVVSPKFSKVCANIFLELLT